MLRILGTVVTLCLGFVLVQGQTFVPMSKGLAVVIVAAQPNCPIVFEKLQPMVSADGKRPILSYRIRNSSKKGIRYFSVEFLKRTAMPEWGTGDISTGFSVGAHDGSGPVLLRPGARFSDHDRGTPKLSRLHAPDKQFRQPKIVWIAFVTKVIFEDGSQYDESESVAGVADLLFQIR